MNDVALFNRLESNVRTYCRDFPVVFRSALGAWLTDDADLEYLDLLAGAGSLNYGHNDEAIVSRVIDYWRRGGIVQSLDMFTEAKHEFVSIFEERILIPRKLRYKLQFPGPTGTNAVEAALKLARKVTGRQIVVAFTNGFHGMTLGSLSATASARARGGATGQLRDTVFMPYPGFMGAGVDALDYLEAMMRPGSGIDAPAAMILETVQGEGGLAAINDVDFRRLAEICRSVGALLIVDDIQAGCGRAGEFFSFESLGATPDIVVLSKSISGFGAPMALVLFRPELDQWLPGEHNGTFRGHNLAFVGAAAAIDIYWRDGTLAAGVEARAHLVLRRLTEIAALSERGAMRPVGRGLMRGLSFADPSTASAVRERLFADRIIAETCGASGQVLKLLPPLTIAKDDLAWGLDRIETAVADLTSAPRLAMAGSR